MLSKINSPDFPGQQRPCLLFNKCSNSTNRHSIQILILYVMRSSSRCFHWCPGLLCASTVCFSRLVSTDMSPKPLINQIWKKIRPIRHKTGHFRDESLQAINCTCTDFQKQGNKTLHTPKCKRETEKNKLLPTDSFKCASACVSTFTVIIYFISVIYFRSLAYTA